MGTERFNLSDMEKKIAVILVNYQEYAKKYLQDCYRGLLHQDYRGELKIMIVDNASTSESFEYLQNNAPQAEIIKNEHNDGFAKGNNDAIKLALAWGYDYIFLLNMDTIIELNAISELVKVLEEDNSRGAVQAKLLLHPETDKINSLGNATHFLGFGYCLGYRDLAAKYQDLSVKNIFYPSGAAVLFRAEALNKVGLFDERFWMYNEDQDLGWRLWLSGYKIVLAPTALVYHRYEFSRSISKYYYMDRNRILAILKNYHWLTLLLIIPAGIVMELGLAFFALKSGWFKKKLAVWGYFLNPFHWVYIIKARNSIQKKRTLKEKEIVKMISGRIWYQEVDSPLLRLANVFLSIYWFCIKRLIILLNI